MTNSDPEKPNSPIDIQEPKVRFDELAGVEDTEELRKAALQLGRELDPTYEKDSFSERSTKLLLHGINGVGKRALAEAIAYDLQYRCFKCGHVATNKPIKDGVRLVKIDTSDLLSQYAGKTPKKIDKVFDLTVRVAKDAGYTVLRLDNLGAIAPAEPSSNAARHERSTIIDTLLNGLKSRELIENRILIVGTAETPFEIDPRIRKTFTHSQLIKLPLNPSTIADTWRSLTDDLANPHSLDYNQLANASVGMTPHELNQVHNLITEESDNNNTKDTLSGSITTNRYLSELEERNPVHLQNYQSQLEEHTDQLHAYPDLQTFYDESLSDINTE